MTGLRACKQCRLAKRRCARNESNEPCPQCVRRQIPCSSNRKTIRTPEILPRQGPNPDSDLSGQDGIDIPLETIIELVEHYINKLHDRPHSLFHLPTLRNNVQNGSISPALLLAICSLGSRFSGSPDIRMREQKFTDQSKRLILADLENMCLENLQACILVANICAADMKPKSEALFFRIAVGMAQIMQITVFDPADSMVLREIKRRVWWTLFMADRWYSSGISLARQLNDCDRPTDLPMDESKFHDLTNDHHTIATPYKAGLWAYMIKLVDLFGPIQDLSRRIVQGDIEADEVEAATRDLSYQLDLWEEALPSDMKLNDENLEKHKTCNTGGPFVALHLGFHHYATLLYFQYLDTEQVSKEARLYAERCKYHASSFSALMTFTREREGFEAVYLTVGHMTIVSSSVLVHTLLFGDEDQLLSTRNCLNSNFEVLIELERYWPALKLMINRLKLFQNMCLLSLNRRTHSLNGWMIRFLIEHALPIEENSWSNTTPTSADDLQVISSEKKRFTERGRFTSLPF